MGQETPALIYVHGGGFQPPEPELLGDLNRALALPPSVPSSVAYYADLIDRVRPRPNPLDAVLADPSVPPHDAAREVVAAAEPAPGQVVSPKREESACDFVESLLRCWRAFTPPSEVVMVEADALIDAVKYLWLGWRRIIFPRVAARVADTEGPLIVVAHSLGSVVAHDVLSSRLTRDVRLLLTAGSPLGIPLVQARLLGRLLCFTRVPRPVRRWVNVYDERDPVSCLDPTVEGEFHPAAKAHDLGPVVNPAPNHHDLEGYLRLAPVRDEVSVSLSASPS